MDAILLNKIPAKGLEIHETITFDSSYYQNTDILELKNIEVNGIIYPNSLGDYILELEIEGSMKIPDSRTLDPISSPISIKIEEKIDDNTEYLEKNKNILDIMGILWENIVLEVPISKTESENTEQKGNGWELKEESKETMDPRLAPLRQLLDKEKE